MEAKKEKIVIEGGIVTPDGFYIKLDRGKFRSNLLWISRGNEVTYIVPSKDSREWSFLSGIDARMFEIFFGRFGKTKKGREAFWFSIENSPHILVCAVWGGAFEKSRGGVEKFVEEKALYVHRASSNGGGMGCTWLIFSRDNLNVNVEDF